MTALQTLIQLKSQELKNKFPGFPDYALPRTRYTDSTANGLTKCIIDYIRLTGGHAERVAIMGRQIGSGFQRKWLPSSGTKGTADIHAMKAGRFVAIEVKIGTDRQSEHQKKYQVNVEQSGGVYLIVKSFENFLEQWNKI